MDKNIAELRQQTKWFIGLDPTQVNLRTTATTKVNGGGTVVSDGPDRGLQTFKIIWPGGSTSGIFANFDGEDVQYDLIIVAAHDAIIGIGDYWTEDGVKYVVEGFAPKNHYEIKAAVKAYGRNPHGG